MTPWGESGPRRIRSKVQPVVPTGPQAGTNDANARRRPVSPSRARKYRESRNRALCRAKPPIAKLPSRARCARRQAAFSVAISAATAAHGGASGPCSSRVRPDFSSRRRSFRRFLKRLPARLNSVRWIWASSPTLTARRPARA